MNANVANVLRTYNRATADEIAFGLQWFSQASGEACRRIPDRPKPVVLGVVAALSPQTAWARNIRLAEHLVYHGDCSSSGSRKATARDILNGARPEERLGGNKVRAFYECLLDHDSDAVCVDGHGFSSWKGIRIATSKCPRISNREYRVIADDFREAAGIVGIKPNQMQAINWLAWRRLHGVRREIDPAWGR